MKANYQAAGYQPPDMGPFHCGGCVHFDTSGACELVDGQIEDEGCCNLYSKGQPQAGEAAQAPIGQQQNKAAVLSQIQQRLRTPVTPYGRP